MAIPIVARTTDPRGEPYLVLGGPCGDVMREVPESGPFSYMTTSIGDVGLLGWLYNRLMHGGRWQLEICPDATARGPGRPPILASWTMRKREAWDLAEPLARRLHEDGVDAACAWMAERIGPQPA